MVQSSLNNNLLLTENDPTAERLSRGKFKRVVPDDAGDVRRVLKDLHADAVMKLHETGAIGDNELAAAVKFAGLASRYNQQIGAPRMAAASLDGRVDGTHHDESHQAQRDLKLKADYHAAVNVLLPAERLMLTEILFEGRTIQQAAPKVVGTIYKTRQQQGPGAAMLVSTGLQRLAQHWGMG